MRVIVALVFGFWTTIAGAVPLPKGFAPSGLNGSRGPASESNEVTFNIVPQDCGKADYRNGSGENDCMNGNVKNLMRQKAEASVGQSVEYKFDIWVDPTFSYEGYQQAETYGIGGDGYDSRLRIAYWEGPARKNFIADLKLDARHGIAFRFKQCQAPVDFGKWVTFSMKIRWASDESGWIRVTCDENVLYEAEGVVTNESVTCYPSNECDPEQPQKNAKRISFQLGLSMTGWGPNWKELYGPTIGPFTAFDPNGLTIKMRNISVTEGIELYGEADRELVRQLQDRLNALGCDVGVADGVAGKKTRAAALACRSIDGLPTSFVVGNLKAFLDIYSAVGVN